MGESLTSEMEKLYIKTANNYKLLTFLLYLIFSGEGWYLVVVGMVECCNDQIETP